MSSYDQIREAYRRPNGQFGNTPAAPPATSLDTGNQPAPAQSTRTIPGEDLVKIVSRMVSQQRERLPEGADRYDDVVQNACLEIIKTYGTDRIPLSPVRKIVSTTISRAQGHQDLGSTDRRAMRVLREEREARENELGRSLTGWEENALAREIRETWPDPRRRPSQDFLHRARMSQMTGLVRDDGSVIEGQSPWAGSQEPPDQPAGVDPASALGRIEAAVRSGRPFSARRSAWDAMAELRTHDGTEDVPRVQPGLHRSQAATWCRTVMDDYPGSVLGAVDTWQRAEEDQGTVALFAPFGDISEKERDAVCRVLADHPESAEALWDSALSASTYKRDRGSQV